MKKDIKKIIISQLSFLAGAFVSYAIMEVEYSIVINTHVGLTLGYLLGFWHSKN